MKYTIEDLRGKYVKTGTPEAEVFLDACEELGLKWCESGAEPRSVNREFAAIFDDGSDSISNDNTGYGFDLEVFAPRPEWSIYTNTLPLCELTDEQSGQLFNAWRNGVTLQIFFDNDETWKDYNGALCKYDVFRVKQKSERESFVEECTKVMREAGANCPVIQESFGILFDSGKFKLIKDGE